VTFDRWDVCAPPPSGEASPPTWLVTAVPDLRAVLALPDPALPGQTCWSAHPDRGPEDLGWSHHVEWSAADQEALDEVWSAGGDAIVDELIDRWATWWIFHADASLIAVDPDFARRLDEQAGRMYPRRQDGWRARWASTATWIGAFVRTRRRRTWDPPRPTPCAVCGRRFAPEAISPWMITQFGPARYCAACCCRARNGRPSPISREVAANALRSLRDTLGLIPAQSFAETTRISDLPADVRDRAMAALTCTPSVEVAVEALGVDPGRGKWLRVLQASGLVDDAWRPARGTYCLAADGHACRSLGERTIDDYLNANGIEHEPEPAYPGTALRADWRLGDGTFVEYAGLLADPSYRDRLLTKIERAAVADIPVLVISPDDLLHLDRHLGRFRPADTPPASP